MRLIDADATVQYLRRFRCADCDRRKGMKNGKVRFCYEIGDAPCRACDIGDTIEYFLDEDISPTIPAIPMKWLEQRRFETSFHGAEPDIDLNYAFGTVMNEWEKEQEAR